MLGGIQLLVAMLLVSAQGAPASGASQEKEPGSALVVAVRGEVSRVQSARSQRPLVQVLDRVHEGEALHLGKNSRIDLLFDARWLTFTGDGDLKFQRSRWGFPGTIRRERNREMPGELPEQGFDSWTVAEEKPDGETLGIESPRETAIRDEKPTLRWRSSRTQETVRLDLLRVVDGRLELVESWRGLRGRELQVHRPLQPETLYFWVVQSEPEGTKHQAQTWFIVRGPKKIESLNAWIHSLEELRSSDDEDRQVAESLLAIGLERAGLLAEARSSWRALASQGRTLKVASKRGALLERRRLRAPRVSPLIPLPFNIRLHTPKRAPIDPAR